MQKILFITDLHLTPPGETIIGLDPAARFQSVLEDALTTHADAKMMILGGDLTHLGDAQSYAILRDMLEDVAMPVIPMMGNHDARAPFCDAFPDAPQTKAGHIQNVIDLPAHRIITLDTLDERADAPIKHGGHLCAARLAWLDAALAGANGRMPLVFSHHPPFDTGIVGMDRIKLAEGDALLSRLKHAQAHLFFGHMHRNFAGSHDGVPWTCFKSPCHQGPLDLSTPNSSLSIDEPAAYGVLLLEQGSVIAHMQDVIAGRAVHSDTYSG